jgi:hypothetical protein
MLIIQKITIEEIAISVNKYFEHIAINVIWNILSLLKSKVKSSIS